jgi:hypothetical protein
MESDKRPMGRKPIEHIPCMRPNEGVNRAGSMLDTLTDPRDTCILLDIEATLVTKRLKTDEL